MSLSPFRTHILNTSGLLAQTHLPDSILATLRKSTAIQSLLINPSTLDAASRRAKLLLADLARASAAAGKQPTPTAAAHPDEDERLRQVYDLLPRLDPVLPILSPLLTRLRALAPLHANASAAQDRLVVLEHTVARASRREDEARKVVARVEERLAENARSVEANWRSVEARLGDLRERMERLGGA